LNATNERAVSAENHAGEAMAKATDASNKADTANQGVSALKTQLADTVANLDAYKQFAQTTVNFEITSDKLDRDAKMALDQMGANQSQYKRFFIGVEGFTDQVGSTDYNAALSRHRADAAVEYFVAARDIPVHRVHMVGLGKQKPVEEGRTRAANAKNRRVEVTLLSADQNLTGS
jgi:outer membrane protein OmpA-like peptidoglycan-associated protein